MTLTTARQVADAVLYEGYLLYPYRASSSKNQVRWQFGILGPAGAVAAGVGEETSLASEVVLEAAPDATLDLHLRFLQVQARVVEQPSAKGWDAVDEFVVGASRWIPFHEAVAQEVPVLGVRLGELAKGVTVPVDVDGCVHVEELSEGGTVVGRLVRTRWPLNGTITLSIRPGADDRLVVLSLRVDNETRWSPEPVPGWGARDVAARYSFVGTHLLVRADGTDFVSLLDGPDWADADTSSCTQQRCWPVMVAEDDGKDAVLVSPIVLGDHPSIAPESVGDLFDATEIDEILTLRVMTMTEEEKAEARGTDPRAAAILARCEAMTDEAMGLLHGARRPTDRLSRSERADVRDGTEVPVYGDDVPWWDEGQDARAEPEHDAVLIGDVPVRKGSRVLLRPSRRADAQDVFLAGMTAVVARVYFDIDGGTHVAVVLEDDPAGDLYDTTGRFYYFGPEEIEPLPAREDAR